MLLVTAYVIGAVPATPPPTGHQIAFGWLALILPVLGLALRVAIRGFTADDRVREKCHKQIMDLHETITARSVRPAIATIVLSVHPRVSWPATGIIARLRGDEPDDETRDQIVRQLAYWPETNEQVASIELLTGSVAQAEAVHDVLVRTARHGAWAMAAFACGWVYIAVCLLFPWVHQPIYALLPTAILLGATAGWAGCAWWFGNERTNFLANLVRSHPPLPGGATQ